MNATNPCLVCRAPTTRRSGFCPECVIEPRFANDLPDRRELRTELDQLSRAADRSAMLSFSVGVVLVALAFWLFSACAAAQTPQVHVANYWGQPFRGWVRATIDGDAGAIGVAKWETGDVAVVGPEFGLGQRIVDLRLDLDAGAARTLSLSPDADAGRGAPPATIAKSWGAVALEPWQMSAAPMTVLGVPLQIVRMAQVGAGWELEMRARPIPQLCVRLFAVLYPGQPWATGEVVVTAANTTLPDLLTVVPAGMTLEHPDVVVLVLGSPSRAIAPAGDTIADGQSIASPVTLVWPAHVATAEDTNSIGAAAALAVGASGLQRLWPGGNPRGERSPQWLTQKWAEAMAKVQSWTPGPLGVNARSGDTGAQEDQGHPGIECAMGLRSAGAEHLRYLVALKQMRRPCTQLEPDGALLDLARHPDLIYWDGRPHWISTDALGKTGGVSMTMAKGWQGPDVEHEFAFSVQLAARLTASQALQFELETLARVMILQHTTRPGWSTSQTYASRAVGWEALNAVNLWFALRDRALAERVRAHWLDRWTKVLRPQLMARAEGVWDWRRDDRLGPGWWWITWQQAVGAYGLETAGRVFGVPEARELALAAARKVVLDGWVFADGVWQTSPQRPVDPRVPARFDRSFNLFGMSWAPSVILLHDPDDPTARGIMQQLIAEAGPAGSNWLPPEILELMDGQKQ